PRARTAAAKSNWTSGGFTCDDCVSSAPRARIFQMSIKRLKPPRRARFGRSLIELCRYATPRKRIEFWNGIRPWEKLFSTQHKTKPLRMDADRIRCTQAHSRSSNQAPENVGSVIYSHESAVLKNKRIIRGR